MLTGQIPFGDANPLLVHQLVDSGERPFLPHSTHPQYAGLVRRCWQADPDKRPLFETVIATLDLCLLPYDADVPQSED
jgi:hypothetical protein